MLSVDFLNTKINHGTHCAHSSENSFLISNLRILVIKNALHRSNYRLNSTRAHLFHAFISTFVGPCSNMSAASFSEDLPPFRGTAAGDFGGEGSDGF